MLGEVIEDENPAPISMEAAFARLKKIRTIRTVLVAFCALGFGLFSQAALASLYLDDTLQVTNVLAARPHPQPVGHRRAAAPSVRRPLLRPRLPHEPGQGARDRRRADPAVGAVHAAAVLVHSTTWFWILGIPQAVLTTCAFAMVGPVLQAVVPYRLRGMGTAMATMYIFFIGGFVGGIIAGFFTDAIGVRGTVIILGVPSASSAGCC